MQPMKQWIAIVEPNESWNSLGPADKKRLLSLPGLTGLDVRIRPGADQVIKDCAAAGKPYRLHSWVGRHDGTRATVDEKEAARQAQQVIEQIGALTLKTNSLPDSYGMNAEKDWWDHNPAATDALRSFVKAFHSSAPWTLNYLGFPLPAYHYGKADWDHDGDVDTVVPDDIQTEFHRLLAMTYQTAEVDLRATILRARRAWPAALMGIFVGTGAMNADHSFVGDEKTILNVARERVGGIDEITHYVGMGRSRVLMLLVGNTLNRPLVERIPIIAKACG